MRRGRGNYTGKQGGRAGHARAARISAGEAPRRCPGAPRRHPGGTMVVAREVAGTLCLRHVDAVRRSVVQVARDL